MTHYIEISYIITNFPEETNSDIKDLAEKYQGIQTDRIHATESLKLEFLFQHFEQASWFTADIQRYYPEISLGTLS